MNRRSGGCADLQELTTCSQARKRPRWIGPAGNDEVEPLGKVLDEEAHRVVHVEGLDDVVVVEHQDDVVSERLEVVDHARDDRFERGRRRLQRPQCLGPDISRHLAHGCDDIQPEHGRIAVASVEGNPRDALGLAVACGEPLGEQRGLAEAGRRGHEHHGW